MQIEIENQAAFTEKFKQAKIAHLEEQKLQELKRQQTELSEKLYKEQQRKAAEEKSKTYQDSIKNSAYNKADKAKQLEMLKQAYNTNN